GPADLESVRVVDRYEGPGAGEGRVKTTIRLLFRSPEKTLEQDHVNREVRRGGDELVSRLGGTFGYLRAWSGKDRRDNTKIFDTLERKIEKMLGRLASLESENTRLKADLASARKHEKDASDSKGAVERLEKDQEAVRERLEKLISSLEAAEKG